MSSEIGKTIRRLRREWGLTQEQLAEAVGVTVGAVSKWESGASSPDIGMLPELADFFEISVDVLLGYQFQSRTAVEWADRIHQFTQDRAFEEGEMVVNQALIKFPNYFEVVYRSSRFFNVKGTVLGDKDSCRRSLELLKRCIPLISQNRDGKISETLLQSMIGETYMIMGENEKALEQLKNYNIRGMNNGMIGQLLMEKGSYQEAVETFSDIFLNSVLELFRTVVGEVQCFLKMGRLEEGLWLLRWYEKMLEGLEKPGKVSYLHRLRAILSEMECLCCIEQKNRQQAERALKKAYAMGKLFNESPDYGAENIRFYHGEKAGIGDDFGEDILDAMEKQILDSEKEYPGLIKLWQKAKGGSVE